MFVRYFSIITALILCNISAFAGDPYTVRGVHVDATAENVLNAQTVAISEGQLRAANIIINRMSLASERAAKGFQSVSQRDGEKMIRALEIANEKRSASRYLGDITIAFNPNAISQYMRAKGLTLIASQSRKRLVIPVLQGESPWADNEWSRAWQSAQIDNALTPMQALTPLAGLEQVMYNIHDANIDMEDLRVIGQAFGVEQILIVEAQQSYSGYTTSVTDIALDTQKVRRMGLVNSSSPEESIADIVALVENDWKASAVNLSSAKSVILPVSVRYRSHAEWLSLQDIINGTAQIRSAQLTAISKRGALMLLTYGGDIEKLRNELAYKGIRLSQDDNSGMVLSRTGAF